MKSTYQAYFGHKDIDADALTTEKFDQQGGISGRPESTGLGTFTATKILMTNPLIAKNLKVAAGLAGKSFIFQGFGNFGYFASKYISGEGCRLIGIAEVDGGIFNPNGFYYQ